MKKIRIPDTFHVKNMVCPRCRMAVENILNKLKIKYSSVELGEVALSESLSQEKIEEFKVALNTLGFELLESDQSILTSSVKNLIIQQVRHPKKTLRTNYSDYLSDKTDYEYSYLSRVFSSTEGTTIEKYITKQKIERVKELLLYNQMTLSEIAFELNYSSAAYLSAQFKKETGITPTEFKKSKNHQRKSLDEF